MTVKPGFASMHADVMVTRPSTDNFGWIKANNPELYLGYGKVLQTERSWWRLVRCGVMDAYVRRLFASGTTHAQQSNVRYYEGQLWAERYVRTEFAGGHVDYYEGERGEELLVGAEFADGWVDYYEGDRGAERRVRKEFADGRVRYYEGGRIACRVRKW
jgi:hypothetical protein